MSHTERRAVLLLLALAVGGQAIRLWLLRPEGAPGAIHLLGPDSSGSAAAHRDSAAVADRPLGPGERIDVDRASARELARLPHVGPALARRIVADRQARGAFGGFSGLDRVPGVGPGLLGHVRDHVEFSGQAAVPGPAAVPVVDPGSSAPASSSGKRDTIATAVSAVSPSPTASIALNTAAAGDLDRLPGIGPSLAGRIVAWRQSHGPFGKIDDLMQVPGVGPAILARIRDRIILGD